MSKKLVSRAVKRLSVVPIINISANLFGVAVTFVWFSVIEPRVTDTALTTTVWDALIFSVLLMALVLLAIFPVYIGRVFRPLLRESRRVTKDDLHRPLDPAERATLLSLVGRILDLPIKIALASLICWLAMAFAMGLAPHVMPLIFPWAPGKSHKMVVWILFVGAPSTVVFAYFALEGWLRRTIYLTFPHEVLRFVPPSRKMNVLPKVMLVTFMLGSLPVAFMSQLILHRIQDIQAGRQSLESFVTQMPLAVEFILGWALILAAGLSLFLSKSISRPLTYARLAMQKIGRGDLDTVVPVVSNDDIGRMGEQFNRMLQEIKN